MLSIFLHRKQFPFFQMRIPAQKNGLYLTVCYLELHGAHRISIKGSISTLTVSMHSHDVYLIDKGREKMYAVVAETNAKSA